MGGIFGSINSVHLSGNLGQEPEFHTNANGDPYCYGSIAVDGWDTKSKSRTTMWIKFICFGKVSENLGEWAKKGTTIYITGSLSENNWTDKNGVSRTSYQVTASDVTILKNGREKNELRSNPNVDTPEAAAKAAAGPAYIEALRKAGFSPDQIMQVIKPNASASPSASSTNTGTILIEGVDSDLP